jgi:hypothetical protein
MLVEERDCQNAIVCLLCKTPFRVHPEQTEMDLGKNQTGENRENKE